MRCPNPSALLLYTSPQKTKTLFQKETGPYTLNQKTKITKVLLLLVLPLRP